jgi:glycosyltransferase involved in cell wall biosynthesis
MRVLNLYAGNLYGGIERMLVTLAKTSARDASAPPMSHAFALCFEGRLAEELRAAGAPVYMLASNVKFSRPWTIRAARIALKRLSERERFHIVIAHSCWPHALLAPAIRRVGLPLVFWAHAPASGAHWLERWARRIPPDFVIANSRFTLASMPNLFPGIPAGVVYCPVAPPNVDANARNDVRRELGTSLDAVVIVIAARFEEWKGHRVLLRALQTLKDAPKLECWIAGEAQRPAEQIYLNELRAAARARPVKFLGHRQDVPRVLAAGDIYCQPNAAPEPFGIVFVEALYAGLPVVTSRLGGGIEIVDECCGMLIPADDEKALASALRELIINPNRRAQLAAHGPARAAELCDPSIVLPKLLNTLQRVATSKAGAT